MLQAFDTIVTQDEPQLERTEAPAERNLPIAIINHSARFRRLVAQVFGQHAQGLDERLPVRNVEDIAIEVGEHPLVRVEAVAVGEFDAAMNVAELGTERRRS